MKHSKAHVIWMVLPLGWLGVNLVMLFNGPAVWDDAYMIARYADHLHSEGVMSWNSNEGAVYGMTSPAWVLWVSLFRFFISSPALLMWVSSVFAGGLFLLLFLQLIRRHVNVMEAPSARQFFIISLGVAGAQLAVHFTSGMDTALAMLALTGYILLMKNWERTPSPGRSLFLGVVGGALWWVRPELILFSILVPVFLALFSKSPAHRNRAWIALLFTVFSLTLSAVVLMSVFDPFLPLSFFVKSGNPYGASFMNYYRWVPAQQLAAFAVAVIPSTWMIVWSARRKEFSAGELGLMAAAILFILGFLFGVLQVMPFHARFYFPLFPVVVWLALRGFPQWKSESFSSKTPAAIAVLLCMAGGWVMHGWPEGARARLGRFSMEEVYSLAGRKTWPLLSEIAQLPDSLSMAATEVGLPGAWCPGKKIFDLAGLNDPEGAGKPFTATAFFKKFRPEIIFTPHPHYGLMLKEMETNVVFQTEYEYFPAEKTHTFIGIALLKKGAYYGVLRDALLRHLAESQ
jgi:hypothetical protein